MYGHPLMVEQQKRAFAPSNLPRCYYRACFALATAAPGIPSAQARKIVHRLGLEMSDRFHDNAVPSMTVISSVALRRGLGLPVSPSGTKPTSGDCTCQ